MKQKNWAYGSYIAKCEDKIYQTNNNTNACTCYTIKVEQLWEFKDVSVLNDPRGLIMDNNYKVYVTSRTSNSIVVIEPDGRQEQLISSDEGLEYSIGIYFNKLKTHFDGYQLSRTGFLVSYVLNIYLVVERICYFIFLLSDTFHIL